MGLFRKKSPRESRSPSPRTAAEDQGNGSNTHQNENVDDTRRRTRSSRSPSPRPRSSSVARGVEEIMIKPYIEEDNLIFEVVEPRALDTSRIEKSSDIGHNEKQMMTKVLRYCHNCRSTFDRTGVCPFCQHEYCRKCTRFPERSALSRPPEGRRKLEDKASTTGEATATQPTARARRSSDPGSKPSWTSENNKIPVRMCHECKIPFDPATRTCQECHHIQCSKCPRYIPPKHQPSKPSISNDTTVSKRSAADITTPPPPESTSDRTPGTRQRVRYTCEKCSTLFCEGVRVCQSCGHERCRMCLREPPKRRCHAKGTRTRHSNEKGDGDPAVQAIAEAAATEGAAASLENAAAAAVLADAVSGGAGAVRAGSAEVAPVAAA